MRDLVLRWTRFADAGAPDRDCLNLLVKRRRNCRGNCARKESNYER